MSDLSFRHRPPELASEELESLALHYHVAVVDARASVSEYARRHLLRSLYAPLSPPLFSTVVPKLVPSTAAVALVVERRAVDASFETLRAAGHRRFAGWARPEALDACRSDLLGRFDVLDLEEARRDARQGGLALVDVRDSAEVAKAPLEAAKNMVLGRLLARRATPRVDETLALYSPHGLRAAVAAAWLRRDGYRVSWVQPPREAAKAPGKRAGLAHRSLAAAVAQQ